MRDAVLDLELDYTTEEEWTFRLLGPRSTVEAFGAGYRSEEEATLAALRLFRELGP